MLQKLRDYLADLAYSLNRIKGWAMLTMVLLAGVWWIAPQQLSVILYKVVLVTLAATIAFLVDRTMFRRLDPVSREHMFGTSVVGAARVLARAVVLLAVVLGLTGGI